MCQKGRPAGVTSPCFLSTFRSETGAESARGLHQRTADAETTPSRSLGAGVVGRMRENADLALIRPVEASALVGEGPAAWNFEYRCLRIRASIAGPPYAQFPFFSLEALGSQTN